MCSKDELDKPDCTDYTLPPIFGEGLILLISSLKKFLVKISTVLLAGETKQPGG